VAYCNSHGIRACLTPPNVLSYINDKFEKAVNNSTEEELSMWRCPDVNGSCWSKAHSFYIERGLWKKPSQSQRKKDGDISQVHAVKLSCKLYQNKEDWMLKHALISRKNGKPGRKSRKRPTAPTRMEADAASTTRRKRRNVATTTTNVDDTAGVSGETGDNYDSDETLDSLQEAVKHSI
jgi:hypothetical protein